MEEEEEELAHKSLPREGERQGGRSLLPLVVACLSVSSSSRFRRSVTSTKYEPGLVWRTTIELRERRIKSRDH